MLDLGESSRLVRIIGGGDIATGTQHQGILKSHTQCSKLMIIPQLRRKLFSWTIANENASIVSFYVLQIWTLRIGRASQSN